MAFTIQDYHDLVQLLVEHPTWKAELRGLLLSDELLALPGVVKELAEAQRRTEERLDVLTESVKGLAEAQRRTEERLDALTETVKELAEAQRRTEERLDALTESVKGLAEAQRRTEERLDALTETVKELAEAQRRTEERLDALAEAQRRTEERLDALTETVKGLAEAQQRTEERLNALIKSHERLTDIVGGLQGRMLEITYRDRAGAYFGRLLRRVKAVEPYILEDMLEETLSPDEFDDFLLLDLLVTGKPRQSPESSDIWLAVEISSVVDQNDIERAVRRASLLRRTGYRVVPGVAGESITQGGEAAAEAHRVLLMQDGRVRFWQESLNGWTSEH